MYEALEEYGDTWMVTREEWVDTLSTCGLPRKASGYMVRLSAVVFLTKGRCCRTIASLCAPYIHDTHGVWPLCVHTYIYEHIQTRWDSLRVVHAYIYRWIHTHGEIIRSCSYIHIHEHINTRCLSAVVHTYIYTWTHTHTVRLSAVVFIRKGRCCRTIADLWIHTYI